MRGGGEFYILTAKFEGEDRPVGLVEARFSQHRLHPSVFWFPWASHRNKLECAVEFLNDRRHTKLILIEAEEKDWRFYDHLLRYGMMIRGSKTYDYFERGKAAKRYQTRGFVGAA